MWTVSQDKGSVRFSEDDSETTKMNTKLLATPIEKFRLGAKPQNSLDNNAINEGDDDNDDYSASASVILRKYSCKKGQRRPSSPFSHEDFSAQSTPRRRSSVFTTTSDTVISMEDPEIKEEQIFENIHLHKEVIANVKQQPWPIRRKLKLIEQAKAYVKRHEGELQVRLKHSRSTRDILTRFKIVLIKKWQHMKREIINFMNLLIPWELRIKEIESHFGTVVASYFTFLRWLFWVNLVISIILTTFVIVPEILVMKKGALDKRKELLPNEKKINFEMLLNFEGVLKNSPIFYGYYSHTEQIADYKISTAYFMIGIGVYIYSFIATLRKMAANFRSSKLSEKEDECIFTWKLFTGWDYMIGNAETGHNRTSSIILGFKEALLEEAEKKKEKQSWKVISTRILINLVVFSMLVFSAKCVIFVVEKSGDRETVNENESFIVKWWRQNETAAVMMLIDSVFPFIFELFGFIEKYHPRKTLRIQLGRIMALNLLNLYTLTFALFSQIENMTRESDKIHYSLINVTIGTNNISTLNQTIDVPDMLNDKFKIISALDTEKTRIKRDLDTDFNEMYLIAAINSSTKKPRSTERFSRTTSLTDKFRYDSFPDPAISYTGHMLNALKLNENHSYPFNTVRIDANDDSNIFQAPHQIEQYFTTITITQTDGTDNFSEVHTTPNINKNTLSETNSSNYDYFSSTTTSNDLYDEFNDTLLDKNSTAETMETIIYDALDDNETTSELPFSSFSPTTLLINSVSQDEVRTLATNTVFLSSSSTESMLNITYIAFEPISNRSTKTETESVTANTQLFTMQPDRSSTTTNVPTQPTCSKDISDEDRNIPSELFSRLSDHDRLKLRRLCWETMVGHELVKLTILDLASNIVSTFFGDFIRALLVRYMNKFWCWDLEKKFPKYADFKIAENILHLVNSQGLVWMGMFFSPGLPLINVVKLMIMMYLRSWAVLTCNVPHEVVFRASRSNNFYLALLLTMLFLCVLPVCYAIVWLKPSWHCGPFSNYKKIYLIFVRTLKNTAPVRLHLIMDYMASPGTVIPLIIVLMLVIYYLASLTSALREANIDLKVQLRQERTEERKKVYQMANKRKRGGSYIDSTFAKWKKLLQEVPSSKLSGETRFPDYDRKKGNDDTDVDIELIHDDKKTKIKQIIRLKKPESLAEKKWDDLLKMVPKAKKEIIERKDSTSTTSSLQDDSSTRSDHIPEIKISRVQTVENINKTATKEKEQTRLTKSITDEKKEDLRSDLKKQNIVKDKSQPKCSFKNISKTATLDSETEYVLDVGSEEVDDDVFLDNANVDVPEMQQIPESISHRIKHRLKKVVTVSSSGEETENAQSSSYDKSLKEDNRQFDYDEEKDAVMSTCEANLKKLKKGDRNKLLKSESVQFEKSSSQSFIRRRSSLDEIHLFLNK